MIVGMSTTAFVSIRVGRSLPLWHDYALAMLFTQFLVLLAESKLHVDQLTRHEAVLRIQGGRPVTVFHTSDRDVSAMTGQAVPM